MGMPTPRPIARAWEEVEDVWATVAGRIGAGVGEVLGVVEEAWEGVAVAEVVTTTTAAGVVEEVVATAAGVVEEVEGTAAEVTEDVVAIAAGVVDEAGGVETVEGTVTTTAGVVGEVVEEGEDVVITDWVVVLGDEVVIDVVEEDVVIITMVGVEEDDGLLLVLAMVLINTGVGVAEVVAGEVKRTTGGEVGCVWLASALVTLAGIEGMLLKGVAPYTVSQDTV